MDSSSRVLSWFVVGCALTIGILGVNNSQPSQPPAIQGTSVVGGEIYSTQEVLTPQGSIEVSRREIVRQQLVCASDMGINQRGEFVQLNNQLGTHRLRNHQIPNGGC